MAKVELDEEEMYAVVRALSEMVEIIDTVEVPWHRVDDRTRGLRAVAANLHDTLQDEPQAAPSMNGIFADIRPKAEIFPGTYEQLDGIRVR